MILLNDFIFDWHLLRELELTDMPISAIGKNTFFNDDTLKKFVQEVVSFPLLLLEPLDVEILGASS